MSGPRYDWASVDRYLERHTPGLDLHGSRRYQAEVKLSTMLGFDSHAGRQSIGRWRKSDTMSSIIADQIAVNLGLHPCLIWPTWFEDAADEIKCVWCRRWVSLSTNQQRRFCSDGCHTSLRNQIASDTHRQKRFWRRIDVVTARVAAMNDEALSEFLGIAA